MTPLSDLIAAKGAANIPADIVSARGKVLDLVTGALLGKGECRGSAVNTIVGTVPPVMGAACDR